VRFRVSPSVVTGAVAIEYVDANGFPAQIQREVDRFVSAPVGACASELAVDKSIDQVSPDAT